MRSDRHTSYQETEYINIRFYPFVYVTFKWTSEGSKLTPFHDNLKQKQKQRKMNVKSVPPEILYIDG